MDNNIEEKLKSVFIKVFKTDKENITKETDVFNLKGWDSLAHVNLMIDVEKEFGITIEADAVIRLISFASIINYINKTNSNSIK